MSATTVQVKICGLTDLDDARAALDFGADWLGFVLYEKSPRSISRNLLRRIMEKLPGHVPSLAVFVNASRADVLSVAGDCGLSAVQIHGAEPPAEFKDIPFPVWRAVTFVDKAPQPDPEDWPARRYVIDAAVKGRFGGTGQTADWDRAAEFCRMRPAMLAGGLDPDNVIAAIGRVHPLGVDVSSGVELRPGKKCHRKMELFISRAKSQARD